MKLSVLKRLVREAAAESVPSKRAVDGFVAEMQDDISAAAKALLARIVAVAETFESDPDYGEWINAWNFENDDQIEQRLRSAIEEAVDEAVTRIVTDNIASAEDRASNGDSFNTNVYVHARDKRHAWTDAAKARARARQI